MLKINDLYRGMLYDDQHSGYNLLWLPSLRVRLHVRYMYKSMNWSIFRSKYNFAQQSNDEDRRFIPQDAAWWWTLRIVRMQLTMASKFTFGLNLSSNTGQFVDPCLWLTNTSPLFSAPTTDKLKFGGHKFCREYLRSQTNFQRARAYTHTLSHLPRTNLRAKFSWSGKF